MFFRLRDFMQLFNNKLINLGLRTGKPRKMRIWSLENHPRSVSEPSKIDPGVLSWRWNGV